MFTSSFKLQAPQFIMPQWSTPASLERLGQWLGILLGTLFSPSWFFTKTVLSYYLPLNTLFGQGVNAAAILEFVTRLEALGPSILLGQMVPILLICQVVSLTFLYCCVCLGKGAVRILDRTRRTRVV